MPSVLSGSGCVKCKNVVFCPALGVLNVKLMSGSGCNINFLVVQRLQKCCLRIEFAILPSHLRF